MLDHSSAYKLQSGVNAVLGHTPVWQRAMPLNSAHHRMQGARHALRAKLAATFADAMFPPVRVHGGGGEDAAAARAEDYSRLLQKAAGTAANHARFLEMFLV